MIKSTLTSNKLSKPIYQSTNDISITSLSKILKCNTLIYQDEEIAHLQTKEIENLDQYYDENYDFFDQSDEDDIIYKVLDGKKIFRQEHQLNILSKKINLIDNMKILDFGCAKGTVMKRLKHQRQNLDVYLYDVSKRYEKLWQSFLSDENYSSYEIKPEWNNCFDVVTSFFALEHTFDPINELKKVYNLLKGGGYVYIIVPNIYENYGDFIVVDHVHHYSEISLKYLLNKSGFELVEIDDKSHQSAYIAIGRKVDKTINFESDPREVDVFNRRILEINNYWKNLRAKIIEFESKFPNQESAIYGAGVYGNFIITNVKNIKNIKCFIDQNPLLHNTKVFGLDVVPVDNIPNSLKNIYVGLNPKLGRKIISELNVFNEKVYNILYL